MASKPIVLGGVFGQEQSASQPIVSSDFLNKTEKEWLASDKEEIEKERIELFGDEAIPPPSLPILTDDMSLVERNAKLQTYLAAYNGYQKQKMKARVSFARKLAQELHDLRRENDELTGKSSDIPPVESDELVLYAQKLEADLERRLNERKPFRALDELLEFATFMGIS